MSSVYECVCVPGGGVCVCVVSRGCVWILLDMNVGWWGVLSGCVSAKCGCICVISLVVSVFVLFAKGESKWYLWGVSAECVQCWVGCMCVMSALLACRWLPAGCIVMLPSRNLCVKCLMLFLTSEPVLGQRLLPLGWLGRHE